MTQPATRAAGAKTRNTAAAPTHAPTPAPAQQSPADASASAMNDAWKSISAMAGLKLPMDALSQLQSDYVAQATELWNGALAAATGLAHSAQPSR